MGRRLIAVVFVLFIAVGRVDAMQSPLRGGFSSCGSSGFASPLSSSPQSPVQSPGSSQSPRSLAKQSPKYRPTPQLSTQSPKSVVGGASSNAIIPIRQPLLPTKDSRPAYLWQLFCMKLLLDKHKQEEPGSFYSISPAGLGEMGLPWLDWAPVFVKRVVDYACEAAGDAGYTKYLDGNLWKKDLPSYLECMKIKDVVRSNKDVVRNMQNPGAFAVSYLEVLGFHEQLIKDALNSQASVAIV